MKKILVTGFTGTVGHEVARKLQAKNADFICGVRNVGKAKAQYGDGFQYIELDFSNPATFEPALQQVDRVFLMYPPGIQGVEPIKEFLQKAKELNIGHVVYLSVKDVQYMPFLPHYKNEKAIKRNEIPYTFLRAGYFMQNLNMFLRRELQARSRIFVPAGKGKTSFIDVRDIAEVAARALIEGGQHKNKAYVLTGNEALDFYQVAAIMSDILKREIHYANPNAKAFQKHMLSLGEDPAYINVVTGIHFFTNIGLAKGITEEFTQITKQTPIKITQYIEDYKENWL